MLRPVVVTAGIILEGSRVLIAKRNYRGFMGGMWEFPGGKVEQGETPSVCLARELDEELAIKAARITYFDSSFYEYGRRRILLIGMLVEDLLCPPIAKEHEELAWVEFSELHLVQLAPADVPFARRLNRIQIVQDSGRS
mgnify:FL=1